MNLWLSDCTQALREPPGMSRMYFGVSFGVANFEAEPFQDPYGIMGNEISWRAFIGSKFTAFLTSCLTRNSLPSEIFLVRGG